MVKLLDYNNRIDELLKQSNPFAIITAAHLTNRLMLKRLHGFEPFSGYVRLNRMNLIFSGAAQGR